MNKQINIILSDEAKRKIFLHITGNMKKEFGGFLLGNIERKPSAEGEISHSPGIKLINEISRDIINVYIDDVYCILEEGTSAEFKFTPKATLDALAYTKRTHGVDDDGKTYIAKKNIIGNYHSHGSHNAFFSLVDKEMLKEQDTEELYLVFSPSHQSYTFCYKEKGFKLHDAFLGDNLGSGLYKTRLGIKESKFGINYKRVPSQLGIPNKVTAIEHEI